MYIEATKPPMVKYLRYFILFLISCYGLFITYSSNYSNYSEEFAEVINETKIYSMVCSGKNTSSNNFLVGSISRSVESSNFSRNSNFNTFITLQNEENENRVNGPMANYSSMTKSEIYEYQELLKSQIEEWENNSSSSTYVNLINELEYSNEILKSGNYLYPYSQKDLEAVAYVIHREAGSYWLSNRHRDLVGCVVRNRKTQGGINQDLINPSYYDIINETGQYPYKSWDINTNVIEDYCYESAVRVLEYKVDCPNDLVWQATFEQGKPYEKIYDETLGTTTYFGRR